MLRDTIALYTELSGNDGENTPIVIIGAYLDGYERGKADRPQGEWIEKVERRGCFVGDKPVYSYTCPFCGVKEFKKYPFCHCGADMRVKNELEEVEND